MTADRHRRSLLARIRDRLAAPETAHRHQSDGQVIHAESPDVPEPPRREHLFGSQYAMRMSFDEVMATRGYTGQQVLRQRHRLVAPSDGERQRDAATRRAGYAPGEVLWPSGYGPPRHCPMGHPWATGRVRPAEGRAFMPSELRRWSPAQPLDHLIQDRTDHR